MKAKRGPLSNVWLLNSSVLFFTLILILRLGDIQLAQGQAYKDKAEKQYTVSATGSFNRGSIFFQEKSGRKISAATVVPDYTLAVDPMFVTDAKGLADKLIKFATFDRAEFVLRISHATGRYEEVAKHLGEKQIEGIKLLKDKAIILKKDQARFYPGGSAAAQVVGFVGGGASGLSGRYGLEKYYDETLMRNGDTTSSSFFADLFLKAGQTILSTRAREGDLLTTIEPTVQGMLERVLRDDVLKKYNAAQASGIIMNPETGEIYAMASAPTFDPNSFSKEKNQGVFINPLVEGVYEMGSIIKPLTMAAGIDVGVITAHTTYDDKGFVIVNKKRVSNYDGKGRGVISMQEVLNESLNTGTMFAEDRLGNDRFRQYFKAFGLGEETGIDLPNEARGNIVNLDSPRDIEYQTASFGQGISMTPIETIRALASLANGGVLVTPHVVKSIEYGLGTNHDFVPGNERRVIKKETSHEVTRMLTVVMDKALMAGALKMPHYSIAVKTGTAQLVEDGAYSKSDYLHTFFGYFPSYNPKFIVFLAVKNPRGEAYASHTLSEPFMQITKFLLNYYEVPPDR
jgi:stage V sporulation protein D (sporulation-specific penicillin-binding protein)